MNTPEDREKRHRDIATWARHCSPSVRDPILALLEELRLSDATITKLVERSVLAMSYAEDEPELWEHVEPDCPMLVAVRQLRRRADSEYSLRIKAEAVK